MFKICIRFVLKKHISSVFCATTRFAKVLADLKTANLRTGKTATEFAFQFTQIRRTSVHAGTYIV